MLSTFGTVMAGIFVPSALSLPLLGDLAVPGINAWGEIRIARVTSNIRAQATTTSPVTGKLAPGDSVRVEPVAAGWFKVYEPRLVSRMEAQPLGFVYGNLLEPAASSGSAIAAPAAQAGVFGGR